MAGRWQRLYRGETTVDFYGRRRYGFIFSGALLVVTVVSLFAQGLNLGIDFKGGVAWEAPVSGQLTIESAKQILEDAGIEERSAKFQVLSSGSDQRLRIQAGEQTEAVQTDVRTKLAEKAGSGEDSVSVATVSSTWGRSITSKAVRALLVFMLFVSIFISWRFEWGMALSAIAAMVHDVGISVGVYSVLGLEVTPATVVAFLTILGFSLYDTIVVFDKVHDNTKKYSASRVSYGDITNVSMNQVLMRSINTSLAAVLPVLSLLILGSWILGAVALQEFALALLVGMFLGAYSSIYIATPLLGILKTRETKFKPMASELHLGEEMSRIANSGKKPSRVASADSSASGTAETVTREVASVTAVLSHPPRPRKKQHR